MAIIGIGTDLVKISRIKRIFKKYPKGFSERILHKNELMRMRELKDPKTYIAKRFSAKEAVAKALGTGIAHGVVFKDIEIANNDNGQPFLVLHGKTREIAEGLGVKNTFISLSDEREYAIATVVLES